ncbi:MAG TPA: 8-amino-7-oxononanoate synthase [Nitrospirae bacterium]|nr:8-amino-7-oxononanoate synthase 2 [bacterium BMS3Abin09]GBE40618.1 8-amino-7-oxononanoate synthase 2 [bacterium BMS3Bbin09]HDH34901.1 8-amino-7-oxononanoate synthase [Nitrospirota bacterium]HDN94996.1 8-amino-7-oxononanoate synthase [Nitrospirota bacterium]HDO66942.1 8-amino-7-oxononanoate synthase [Nitrospirota bacterium]
MNVKEFNNELNCLKKQNLLRETVCINSSNGSKIVINGKTYTDFSSNDYLNLSQHPAIISAASNALKKKNLGSGASRLLSGTYTSHERLEKRIASFKKTDAALIFNTGYAANIGIIPALTDNETLIFSDELNHASIIDGTRLSRAGLKVYRHCDMEHLESLLEKGRTNKKINDLMIITDTVFSMDGDIAPLKEIVHLSEKYNALLMIDDAHATGVLGGTGRGGLEHFGINPDRIIQMGTLSKAMGCYGGFAAGTKEMADLLMNKARSFIYSTSLPPVLCDAGIKAIDIIDHRSKALRNKLWKNRERLFKGLNGLGFDTLDSKTPIIPVIAGSADDALKMAKRLYRNRIFVPAIRPPTVSENKCRLRFSVTAGHTNEDIDHVLECLEKTKM